MTRPWITLFDRNIDFNKLTPEAVMDAASYPIVRAGDQPMDKTRLYHSLARLEEVNVSDSEKVRLLTALVTDLIDRIGILEADIEVLSEELNKSN